MPSGRSRSAKAWVLPESNQTSRMSVTFSHSSCGWSLARKRALAPSSNQASAPSFSKASLIRALTAGSRRISAVPSGRRLTKQVSGTPQARWRDSTQSGRASIIE